MACSASLPDDMRDELEQEAENGGLEKISLHVGTDREAWLMSWRLRCRNLSRRLQDETTHLPKTGNSPPRG